MISYEIRAIAMLFRLFSVLFNATQTNLAECQSARALRQREILSVYKREVGKF